jgi:hypothetical protein
MHVSPFTEEGENYLKILKPNLECLRFLVLDALYLVREFALASKSEAMESTGI